MSQVFDALRRQATPSTQAPTAAGSVLASNRRRRLLKLIAAALGMLAITGAVLGLQRLALGQLTVPSAAMVVADTVAHVKQTAPPPKNPPVRTQAATITVPLPVVQAKPLVLSQA